MVKKNPTLKTSTTASTSFFIHHAPKFGYAQNIDVLSVLDYTTPVGSVFHTYYKSFALIAATTEMLFPTLAVLLVQVSLVAGWHTFVVPHAGEQDDIPSLVAAIGDYSINSTILFQKGVHYNIFTPIKFPVLNNVEVRIEGNLSYPTDIPTIQGNACWIYENDDL
ncbi:hypothetical protein C0992_008000 [Termitomyces sp. T32_za158]|nr:hypothetical protein C0992_008000 [Termitomyces sp. T32_za158]